MPTNHDSLMTPIYLKTSPEMDWPAEDKVFYLLSADGLFLCRNHAFFRSCVKAERFPGELAEQDTFLRLHYPKFPRRLLELIVGFFDRIGDLHGSEAGALLAWDTKKQRYRIIVPEQTATVSYSWKGNPFPIGLHYDMPTSLPAHWMLLGDIHSHVDEPAYASGTDKDDEEYRAGLHIVVGRIDREPPEFHIDAVVDRTRFKVPNHLVLEGYRKRRRGVPEEWIQRVTAESLASYRAKQEKSYRPPWDRQEADRKGSQSSGSWNSSNSYCWRPARLADSDNNSSTSQHKEDRDDKRPPSSA